MPSARSRSSSATSRATSSPSCAAPRRCWRGGRRSRAGARGSGRALSGVCTGALGVGSCYKCRRAGDGAGGGVVHAWCRRILVLTGGFALVLAMAAPAPAAEVRHDFDPATLAQYLSLRFSSAVPPTVIRHTLAAEGFSQRDLDLVAASPSTASGGSSAAAAAVSPAAPDA